MMSDDHIIAQACLENYRQTLRNSLERIMHCLKQLDESALWWRPFPEANSVANILLHLCGNIGQWILAPLAGLPDTRDRAGEFAEQGPISGQELITRIHRAVEQADKAIGDLDPNRLLEERIIQGYHTNLLEALSNSVGHFRGHEQEIVYITRLRLEDRYEFATNPDLLNHPPQVD